MDQNKFLSLRKRIIQNEFSRMNEMQFSAIVNTEGPLLILAGAGSGKTTVVVNRIANIIKYGKAYHSDFMPYGLPEDMLSRMEACAEKGEPAPDELVPYLSVEAARPWQILAITFTNKAAGELKDRLHSVIGEPAEDIRASTFHSACARFLRRDADRLGYSSNFTVYDTDDMKRLVKQCQSALGIDDKLLSHKSILAEISKAKNQLILPEDYAVQHASDFRLKRVGEVYNMYQQRMKEANAMDFDDLLVNTVLLLKHNPDILEHYQNLFRYILVDEYQDTNPVQYLLVKLLAEKNRNICVVGDDDQSIYRFRGATIENILSFEETYPDACVIRLEENYRSTQNILDAANNVISNNLQRKGKNLWTGNGKGDEITFYSAADERDEARFITDRILENVKQGMAYREHAVLYRMNAQSNALENVFLRSGVPYRIIGGHRFYDRKEIRDAIAYLNVINNPDDIMRLRRIINEPKRGIGETSLSYALQISSELGVSLMEILRTADEYRLLSRGASRMMAFARMIDELISFSEENSIHALFERMLEVTGYLEMLRAEGPEGEDRIENINELSSNILKYENETEEAGLSGFLEEVSLMTDIDNYDAETDAVVMMTIHAAKGLEFPVVFLPGMEEGIFPGNMSIMGGEAEIEEERRLAYVAITRAKRQLTITAAQTRMLYGNTNRNRPSRFVSEIPKDLLHMEAPKIQAASAFGGLRAEKPKAHSYAAEKAAAFYGAPSPSGAAPSFSAGDVVIHPTFGEGTVLSARPLGNDILLEVAFEGTGTKKLMSKFARLQKA